MVGLRTNIVSWRCRAASGAPAASLPPMAAENSEAVSVAATAPRLERDPSVLASARTPISVHASHPSAGRTPPSAASYDHNYSHAHSASQSSDVNLEPTIRALLSQRAEIETRLATLLPRKYGPNVRFELEMLRHKHRALRAFAENNRKEQSRPFTVMTHASPLAVLWLAFCSAHQVGS